LRDAWFIGYTPNLVIGVWVGADDARSIGMTGSDIALPIWADIMVKAIHWTPPPPFIPPPGIVMAQVDPATGLRACGGRGDAIITEASRQGSEPAGCDSIADSPLIRDVASWFRSIFR